MNKDLRDKSPIAWMIIVALFMSLNIILAGFGIPVPGGHFYFNDIVIVIAALLLDPIGAFISCGVGSFLGDMIFYPAPMFVSLVTHGVQAIIISYIVRKSNYSLKGAILGVTLGAIFMIAGYTFGRAFIYSTVEYAIIKIPYEVLQAVSGAIIGTIITYHYHVNERFIKQFHLESSH